MTPYVGPCVGPYRALLGTFQGPLLLGTLRGPPAPSWVAFAGLAAVSVQSLCFIAVWLAIAIGPGSHVIFILFFI